MSFEDLKQNIIKKKKNQEMLDEIFNREVEPDNRQEIESKNINEDVLPKFEDEGM